MALPCSCGASHEEDAPGSVYWVSVRRQRGYGLAAGPYRTHEEALADVDDARTVAELFDPRSPFYLWGTARTDAEPSRPPGKLNEAIEKMRAVAPEATEATTPGNKPAPSHRKKVRILRA